MGAGRSRIRTASSTLSISFELLASAFVTEIASRHCVAARLLLEGQGADQLEVGRASCEMCGTTHPIRLEHVIALVLINTAVCTVIST